MVTVLSYLAVLIVKIVLLREWSSLKPRFVERLIRSFSIELVILGDVSMVKMLILWDNYEF